MIWSIMKVFNIFENKIKDYVLELPSENPASLIKPKDL